MSAAAEPKQAAELRPDRSASAPLRVLIACDHIAYDGRLHGSGRFLLELLKILESTGVEARACVLRDDGGLALRLASEGWPLSVLRARRFSPSPVLALSARARELRADLIHVWDFGASTWGRLAGLWARIPVVVHVQSHHSRHQRRGFPAYVGIAYRMLAPLTARAVVISSSVRDFARFHMGFRDKQLVTVGYPAPFSVGKPSASAVEELRSQYAIDRDTPVIGTVTRLYPVKGIDVLLDAFADVHRSLPGARLVIVGDGPLREALEARAAALGIGGVTIFAGHRSDVASHYALFAVTVMPSLEEGLGLVALESLAVGTPVVASREGGLPEVVAEGRSGLLVEPGDPRALGAALQRVLCEPGLLAQLRQGCIEEATRFAPERFAEAMLAIYRDAIALGPAFPHRASLASSTQTDRARSGQ